MRPDPRILVVESAPLVRHRICHALERGGFSDVSVTETGTKAMALIEGHRPDVIVIGSDLHDTSTLLFALQIRMTGALRNVRLIMVSHRRSHDDIVAAIRCGIDNYVALPFPEDELSHRIRALAAASSGDFDRPPPPMAA